MSTLELALIRIILWLLLIVGFAVGVIVCWEQFMHPSARPAGQLESAAPAVIQSDGSTLAARAATAPSTKPFNFVPKGAKVLRQESVTVQPKDQTVQLKTSTGLAQTETITPKVVTLNMDLLKMADGTERVTASSPDGQITGALDVPVAPMPPDAPKWGAGVAYGIPTGQVRSEGVWIERDVWRLRFGVEANHISAPRESSNLVMARVGLVW